MFKSPIPLYLIVLLSSLLWMGEYVRRDLWEPDEARYALVAKEMRDGHWLVPFRQGEFYAHKPPLMFWMINAFSLLTGGAVGNVAARLPSFLGAIMALWAASRLATRWFSSRAGWLTVLLLCSSFLFWNKGGFGQIDMLLCGLEMMALYLLFTAEGAQASRRQAVAYLLMGLAMITKGPVGLIIPWGIYLVSGLCPRPRAHLLWGPLVALCIPALWLAAVWWQGAPDGFFEEVLFKQNIGRLAGEFGGHQRPFYYFIPYFLLDFMPWTFVLPLSWQVLKQVPELRVRRLALLKWIVFVIVFFSLSSSKRNLYILIAYPAAAILIAAGADYWMRASSRMIQGTFWVLWSGFLLLGLTMTFGCFMHTVPFNALSLLPSGLVLLPGCVWAYYAYRSGPYESKWLVGMASMNLINFALIGCFVYPEFNGLKTPHGIIEVAQQNLEPSDRIIMYQEQGEIFSLYAERQGVMVKSTQELKAFIDTAPQVRHLIIARESKLAEVESVVGKVDETQPFQMGGKHLVWVLIKPETS